MTLPKLLQHESSLLHQCLVFQERQKSQTLNLITYVTYIITINITIDKYFHNDHLFKIFHLYSITLATNFTDKSSFKFLKILQTDNFAVN